MSRPNQIRSRALLIFGEVLYDCFPDGRRVLGGAPFNVAWALQGLGEQPCLLTAVGADAEGVSIRRSMEDWGLSTDALSCHTEEATGKVMVELLAGEPSYDICCPSAWDSLPSTDIEVTDLLYHGSLALRSAANRSSLEALIEGSSAVRFFDVNLRAPYDSLALIERWIESVQWLKLNLDELRQLSACPDITFADTPQVVHTLRERYAVENVILTAGSAGAWMIGEVGEFSYAPAPSPNVFVDSVGAGDAFSAYAIHGIQQKLPPEQIIAGASQLAAKVCGLTGATTKVSDFYHSLSLR